MCIGTSCGCTLCKAREAKADCAGLELRLAFFRASGMRALHVFKVVDASDRERILVATYKAFVDQITHDCTELRSTGVKIPPSSSTLRSHSCIRPEVRHRDRRTGERLVHRDGPSGVSAEPHHHLRQFGRRVKVGRADAAVWSVRVLMHLVREGTDGKL